MKKDLSIFNNFWRPSLKYHFNVPSVLNGIPRLFSKGLDNEFSRIFNGKCDFEETDDKYVIELELPGIKKDEIKINLRYNTLTISWNRDNEKKRKIGKSYYERQVGSFQRQFNVEGADQEKISAELKHGVLLITITKLEKAKPKKITINS